MTSDERHEDFDNAPVRCRACGDYVDPDEVSRTRRGPMCKHCVRSGEAEIVARPLASGVHVGPLRQFVHGAIGLTTSPHKSPRDGDTSEGMTERMSLDERAA